MIEHSTKPRNEAGPTPAQSSTRSLAQKREIGKRLYALAEALGESLDEKRVDIYFQALADTPYVTLIHYLEKSIRTCKWFPKIPEIREGCGYGEPKLEDQRKLEQSILEAEAEREWRKVVSAVEHGGWHPDQGWRRAQPLGATHGQGRAGFERRVPLLARLGRPQGLLLHPARFHASVLPR